MSDMDGSARTKPAQEHRYPCEQCGADLRYDPGSPELVCDYCGHRQTVKPAGRDRLAAMDEIDLEAGLSQELPSALIEESRVTQCPNCGARFEFDPAVHAAECPFCATPVVADTGIDRHIKPQALLPFKLTEDAARTALSRWLGRLWFAPNGVQEYARKGRRMTGIYTPFWTFDADTRSSYTGMRGDHYYESRTVSDGKGGTRTQRVQKTRWRPASGRVARHFDDVVVLASNSLPRSYVDSLQPWDLSELEPYTPDFLAGFRAEGYTVVLKDGHRIARGVMEGVIVQDVRRDIGGDVQKIASLDTRWSDETFKHILLPLWLAAYKFRGRSFRFIVNGQTGEVQGERPWSWIKITIAVVLAAIAAGIGYYLYELQQQGGGF
jgi:DNA-directed RNA polymerase subunit RPC12/RpoP